MFQLVARFIESFAFPASMCWSLWFTDYLSQFLVEIGMMLS